MQWLNNMLWYEVFTVFNAPVTVIEIIGFVTGLWCVWLVVKQNPLNWPIGLIQVIAYIFLFWSSGLFADSALQIVYLILGLWGWWNWVHKRKDETTLKVRKTYGKEWIILGIIGLLGTGIIYYVLHTYTSSTVPLMDSITTVLSLLATYGQARKLLESWWFWIAADIIYIPLYGYKSLWLTAILYSIFLTFCIIGYRQWKADMVSPNNPNRKTQPIPSVGTP